MGDDLILFSNKKNSHFVFNISKNRGVWIQTYESDTRIIYLSYKFFTKILIILSIDHEYKVYKCLTILNGQRPTYINK